MEMRLTRRGLAAGTTALAGTALLTRMGADAQSSPTTGPAEAAVAQSRLETTGNIYALYRQMHSDSRAEVPLYAVQSWYDREFLPLGPHVLTPTGIRFVDWAWGVTGMTYPGTAEVSFTQRYDDGSVVDDAVRLVQEDGVWRWFFGRSREFLDEQIAIAKSEVFPRHEVPADGWITAIADASEEALDRLPDQYPGGGDAELTTGSGPGGSRGRRYVVPREGYVLGAVDYQTLSSNQGAVSELQDRLDQSAQGPAFEVLAWDLSDGTDVPYATYQAFANDAVGNVIFTIVASDRTGVFWTVTALTREVVDTLGEALAG